MHKRSRELGTVLTSLSGPDNNQCVDIFKRTDGRFGFELYRQDVESGEGWFPIGFYSGTIFATEQEALDAAIIAIPWLEQEL